MTRLLSFVVFLAIALGGCQQKEPMTTESFAKSMTDFESKFESAADDQARSAVLDDVTSSLRKAKVNYDTMLTQLSEEMFNDSLVRLDPVLANGYVDGCELYADIHPDNPNSPEYLHKAAETLRSLKKINESIEVYNRIMSEYPDHPRAVQSLFLKAFTFDNNIHQYDSAQYYYTQFLEKYPDDEFASSAKFLLENLGKTDEELLNVLQEKNKQNAEAGNPESE